MLSDIYHGNTGLSSHGGAGAIGRGLAGSCEIIEVTVLGGVIISHVIDSGSTPGKGGQ